MSNHSFSSRLRDELLDKTRSERRYWEIGFRGMALAAMRFQGREMRFSTRQRGFAQLLSEQIEFLYGAVTECREGKEQSSIILTDPDVIYEIKEDMQRFRDDISGLFFSETVVEFGEDPSAETKYDILAVVLSELFLSCGSLSSPREAYQIEFSFPRKQSALFFKKLLDHFGMDMRLIHHRGYHVLYAKDGQRIADFLLYSGAHTSLLAFEELRVEKEVLNQVNRVVNCDSANAQRLANSSVIQREAILKLQASNLWASLPFELREAGQARLQFPELSLTELGQKMSPPLGKSGMNHRLKKLIAMAEEKTAHSKGKSSRGKTGPGLSKSKRPVIE